MVESSNTAWHNHKCVIYDDQGVLVHVRDMFVKLGNMDSQRATTLAKARLLSDKVKPAFQISAHIANAAIRDMIASARG